LNFDFFKRKNTEQETGDVQSLSWESTTWNVVEDIYTWEYELVQNYEGAWDPFAWLIQPM
jgi:hypothetical protein